MFACGPTLICNGRTEYCDIKSGGVIVPDGGSKSYSCAAIPVKCLPNPTCSCIAASAAEQCTESNGDVTVTEDVP